MKRFEEMTELELAQLDDKGVENLIDFECASRGIKLLPEMPVKPIKTLVEPDLAIHVLKNINFLHHHEATNLAELLKNYKTVNTSGWGSSERAYDSSQDVSITTKMIYSVEKYAEIETELNKYNALVTEYESAKRAYEEIKLERKVIANEINDKRGEVQAVEGRKSELTTLFARYLELAEGNRPMALKFLNNAHPDALDFECIQSLKDEPQILE